MTSGSLRQCIWYEGAHTYFKSASTVALRKCVCYVNRITISKGGWLKMCDLKYINYLIKVFIWLCSVISNPISSQVVQSCMEQELKESLKRAPLNCGIDKPVTAGVRMDQDVSMNVFSHPRWRTLLRLHLEVGQLDHREVHVSRREEMNSGLILQLSYEREVRYIF